MYFQVSIDREEKYKMKWCVVIAETAWLAASIFKDEMGATCWHVPDNTKIAVQKSEPTARGLIAYAKGSTIEYFDYVTVTSNGL